MLDDRFEDRLQEAARDHNAPPDTPREEMWMAIQAERAGGKAEEAERAEGKEAELAEMADMQPESVLPFRPVRSFRSVRPVRLAAGIAAVLALGFGLGRLTGRPDTATQPAILATEVAPRTGEAAYRVVTTEHLSQSEAFLTLFRASVPRGGNEQLASATARQLLATNRLLLDSPAASDARTRLLLQDLELVLAEIAQLSQRSRSYDLDLISEGLEQGGVLSRLRTAVPSGASTTQGAL
jgi:hypothetical protein